ncbi:FAD-dependent oxidoreductase [Rhodococcus sp. APC 3903]|uniref:NAD(P)/FAD-dependent oxidoreductase n=1 Tax=Rhodococcus sp. APC 3903 TaxID=3035193 RepID=UPI0025B55B50|nr:FAD-dependent oxidoreductase [Rhodococcus sp. APC 3903]MDN3460669.1 FAD-dependent oxidoreductase [Rhodococcus sp. APC 3903]
MSTSDRHIVIVGDSIAGCTAARELRARGHLGPIAMIGADSDGSYARPPLSKHILKEGAKEAEVWDLSDLDITAIRGTATGLDTDLQAVLLADGRQVRFDTLIVATGARARRIGAPTQHGELVLRTFADARELGTRLDEADSAIVVGAGFLGMEVASVCAARGIAVTVVDVDAPLQRILGSFLSEAITARARSSPVQIVRTDRPVELIGDPVTGIAHSGRELHADLVVTCAGEIPDSHWLESSGAADKQGVGIDARCATAIPNVFAAGDVTYFRSSARQHRQPFWSNAVAQGKVAAASALGLEPTCPPTDDYFWTEILGLSIKVVGPLPLLGEPTVLDGSVNEGSALLQWTHPNGRKTLVAYGIKKSVGLLRRIAREQTTLTR